MSVRDLTILGCSSQQPTRQRNHGAYLLRWNGEGLLFDPGEGTQRQFIHANIAPTCVTRIFISHFHGDHCLGLGSMLMRLNLDKVTHPIHCYYPASGKKYFDALRYGTIYHETINVVEHPVRAPGVIEEGPNFKIECFALKHGVENLAWRITEPDSIKFSAADLKRFGVQGAAVRELQQKGYIDLPSGERVHIGDVSSTRVGDTFAYVVDTLPCQGASQAAQGAKLLLCEATYLESEVQLAHSHRHLTARQAAEIAQAAGVQHLVLTHFSARYLDLRLFEQEARQIFPNTHAADDLKVFAFPR